MRNVVHRRVGEQSQRLRGDVQEPTVVDADALARQQAVGRLVVAERKQVLVLELRHDPTLEAAGVRR